jgi:hypothetical protein
VKESMRKSPVDEEPQPAIGEVVLRRVRENHLRACVIRAAARAARQCAKELQEEARSACTRACAAGVVHRYLIMQLCRRAYGRSATPLATETRAASGEPCQRWAAEQGGSAPD